MLSGPSRVLRIALIPCLLLWAPATLAQADPAWVNPPSGLFPLQVPKSDPAAPTGAEPSTAPLTGNEPPRTEQAQTNPDDGVLRSSLRSIEPDELVAAESTPTPRPSRSEARPTSRLSAREQATRDLAFKYLDHWSAPNRVALASAPSFYGSSVTFHGRLRSLASVLAEKRRFAERWPDRSYRYRPETTRVACEAHGATCSVRSIFDFAASNPQQGRRSLGIGDHELVVSFSGTRPVILSENSQVLHRGGGYRSSRG